SSGSTRGPNSPQPRCHMDPRIKSEDDAGGWGNQAPKPDPEVSFPPHPPVSSPRRRGGGFSFEVQQVGREGRGGRFPAEAFSRCAVVGGDDGGEQLVIDGGEVGLAWQEASHPADGVLDAALLPG